MELPALSELFETSPKLTELLRSFHTSQHICPRMVHREYVSAVKVVGTFFFERRSPDTGLKCSLLPCPPLPCDSDKGNKRPHGVKIQEPESEATFTEQTWSWRSLPNREIPAWGVKVRNAKRVAVSIMAPEACREGSRTSNF